MELASWIAPRRSGVRVPLAPSDLIARPCGRSRLMARRLSTCLLSPRVPNGYASCRGRCGSWTTEDIMRADPPPDDRRVASELVAVLERRATIRSPGHSYRRDSTWTRLTRSPARNVPLRRSAMNCSPSRPNACCCGVRPRHPRQNDAPAARSPAICAAHGFDSPRSRRACVRQSVCRAIPSRTDACRAPTRPSANHPDPRFRQRHGAWFSARIIHVAPPSWADRGAGRGEDADLEKFSAVDREMNPVKAAEHSAVNSRGIAVAGRHDRIDIEQLGFARMATHG